MELTQEGVMGTDSRWVSFGRLCVLVGEVEARTMVDNKELPEQDHPSRPNAKLHLYSEATVYSTDVNEQCGFITNGL